MIIIEYTCLALHASDHHGAVPSLPHRYIARVLPDAALAPPQDPAQHGAQPPPYTPSSSTTDGAVSGTAALLFHRGTLATALAEQASFYSATSAIDDETAHDSATLAAAAAATAAAAGDGRGGAVVGAEPAPLLFEAALPVALPVGDRWAAWGMRGGGEEPPAWPRPPSIALAEKRAAEMEMEMEKEESARLGAMRESLFPHPIALEASGLCRTTTPTTTPMGAARRGERPLTSSAGGEETPAWLQKLRNGLMPSEVRPRRRVTSAPRRCVCGPIACKCSPRRGATLPPPCPQVPSEVSLYYHAAPNVIEVRPACTCTERRPPPFPAPHQTRTWCAPRMQVLTTAPHRT